MGRKYDEYDYDGAMSDCYAAVDALASCALRNDDRRAAWWLCANWANRVNCYPQETRHAVPRAGAMIFSDYIGKVDTFDVACRKCDRQGKYSLAKLIEQHGPNKMIPWWLEEISVDCPKRDAMNRWNYYDRCGVHLVKD